jgi:DNA-binding GntR family transcriptional regulator
VTLEGFVRRLFPARVFRRFAVVPARTHASKSNAYTEVRRLLLGGEVQPGQRLSHRSLAKDLGLSRSPVREALLQLEAEGIVEHRPQSGVYLRDVSPQELEELYDMRELIEPYAAERAARLASAGQLERLRAACDEVAEIAKRPQLASWLEAAENRRRLSTLDIEFHSTILAASNNRVARRFFENAQVISLVVSWNHFKTDPAILAKRVAPTAKHHREIYEAIKKRDPAMARKLMRAHIGGMSKRVLHDIGRR